MSSMLELERLKELVAEMERRRETSGVAKWFVPGSKMTTPSGFTHPAGIESYPKHKLFFELGKANRERVLLCGNRCLAEGTLVATPEGPRPIETLKIGDMVYNRYKQPTRVIGVYDNGEAPTVSLRNRGKEYLRCTPNHEIYATKLYGPNRGWNSYKNVEMRVPAGNLTRGYLANRYYPECELGYKYVSEAYALGALIGDGAGTCGSKNVISISSANDLVPRRVAESLGASSFVKAGGENYSWYIHSPGTELYDRWCRGKLCHEKVIDLNEVKTWCRASYVELFAGLMDTDGSLAKSKDGYALAFHNQSLSVIRAFEYLALALWQVQVSISVDNRAKYKNGPVYCCYARNPYDVARICKELLPQIQNKYKATMDTEGVGKRSREEAIFLTPHEGKIARVFDITVDDPEHLYLLANGLCVANCGKSIAGAFETACHLTGLYPDWWTGRRFDKPVKFWVAGKDKTTTRDTLQKELFGSINAFGTGMIPAEMIDRTWSMQGVPAGIELANIKHVSGGLSQVGFKSYDRGVDSFFGTAMDGIWLDEECPEDVYGECLLRTMTTNGLLYLTFTPKKGLTPLVLGLAKASKFIDSDRFIEMEEGLENPSRVVVMGSWDDVPHLDEKSKQEILQGTPPALRDAVSKGIPTIGEGTVFPLSRSDIEVEDFPIPPHWKRWYGMDVGGWTACTFMAENPDTGQLYVTGVYKRDRAEPLIHAQGIKNLAKNWMMGAIDPASRQRSQVDGQQLMVMYRNMGLNIVPANNAVDAGISQMWELLSTGKMKVFKSCTPLFSEMMVYRYENGRIKKENDHIMDSWRYAVMTRDKVSRTPPTQNTNLQGYSHGRTFNF